MQGIKELRVIQKRLKKGSLQVQEYGRQQLQGMLSVGPYSYFQVPTPTCASAVSEDSSTQVMIWKRTTVSDCEATITKVRKSAFASAHQMYCSARQTLTCGVYPCYMHEGAPSGGIAGAAVAGVAIGGPALRSAEAHSPRG